mmetsp:Transcript_4895/g.10057  ORF Transcript_4895/g.10057 Transcript_4895/m.10057 type:complete len:640 (-) Transcript_4895:85-2004(-)
MATQQHRVLLYITCYNVLDGVSLTLRKLEQELLAAGHYVCVLTTVSGAPANTHMNGEHPNRQVLFLEDSIPIPFLTDPNNPTLSYELGFHITPSVQKKMDEYEPTLIHISVPDCTALHLVNYARRKEIPLMGTYHSNIPEYMDHYPGLSWLKHILWGFFRHQYNFYQALYVPTPYIKNFLMESQKMDRITDLQVWGRGVDVENFSPSHRNMQFRRELGISDNEVVICWCGRLVPEKGVDIFCDTVRRLNDEGLNFRALVVGAGPCEEEIKALPRTVFCGWMSAAELAVAYASSDVFLFPSSVETFGNVTLEAMASGLPVVVESHCSGHLVHEGENGFACVAGSKDSFFEATRQLVVDKSMRQAYAQRSRELSLTMEKKSVVQQMLSNYAQVTNNFYTEYGGRHRNRDSAFRQPHSFVAGNHPRPILLRLVEVLFIVLFRVIWNMTEVFFMMQRTIISMRPAPVHHHHHHASRNSSPTGASATLPRKSPIKKRASFEPTKMASPSAPSTIVEMQDVDIGATGSDPLLRETEDDCETNTTTSSSSDWQQPQMPAHSSIASIGDWKISNFLSISFIRSAEFLCLMESHARNSCTCQNGLFRGLAKRKNSIDKIEDEEEGRFVSERRPRRMVAQSQTAPLLVV